ncbi:NADH-quinone oxidoreductase subunit M [Rhodosalinus sediminis]|uniref:NADH-quinone oxidoreductase subunit M n=2 Tax=Rhodosalinus sediminis TaxID=1940533 RepID=A0A3D9BXB3_9RHOB|nr:NADH-quinone oxidoreductase subunit M [Rhodosalinus sediminis]REC58173.1 NADH-quinone oxidoreductase subunit M [Rhodosalinus sediminis]
MALIAQLLLPFFGGFAALLAARTGRDRERWVAIAAMAATLAALAAGVALGDDGRWLAFYRADWAPSFGIQVLLAMDGLTAAMLAISSGLGIISVFISWHVTHRSALFHAAICWTVAAANGVFLSFDLLIFAFFWELMIVPAFLLIALWGHGDREAAAIKFLVFNAVAGLGLLAAVFWMGATSDPVTFDAFALAETEYSETAQILLLLGFALAFMVKLPVPPFHAWLPDAHTQAPTAGSILLAGLLLKTGAYGLFRFPPMLFPDALMALAGWGMALGAFGVVYGGILACGQTDAKRLVAYTSVAHMSIVLMGVCGGVHFALIGAGVEMIAHAFSSSALFLLIGALQHRTGTRDLRELGGLQKTAPAFATSFALFFAAALAMPGTANFLGEALVITGMFQVNWVFAAIALVSLVVSVVYATRLIGGIAFGAPKPAVENAPDLHRYELWPIAILGLCALVFGLFPQLLIGWLWTAVEAALQPLIVVQP